MTDVQPRWHWLQQVIAGYAPGPHVQLAAACRRAVHDEQAERVLVARQTRRYAEAGIAGRLPGALHRHTAGFDCLPWSAACWLVLFRLAGAAWFSATRRSPSTTAGLRWFSARLVAPTRVLPIIDLGQDGLWRLDGSARWIGGALVVAGLDSGDDGCNGCCPNTQTSGLKRNVHSNGLSRAENR